MSEHVYSDTTSYRLPVFEVEGEPNSDVVLSKLELADNKHNIAYNNNCIRWIRRVENSTPYFSSNAPAIELHLCSLYLKPNNYSSFDVVVNQMNKELRETKRVLFHEEVDETPSVLVSVYKGEFPAGRKFNITNASFSSFEASKKESINFDALKPLHNELLEAIKKASKYNSVDAFNYIQFARPDIYFFNLGNQLNNISSFLSLITGDEKLSSIVSSVTNEYTPFYNYKNPYSNQGAFYKKIDNIQDTAISTKEKNSYFDSIISQFSDYVELNYTTNIVTQMSNIYLGTDFQSLGLAIANLVVNTVCEYDGKPKVRDAYSNKLKVEIAANETINNLVRRCNNLGIFEINNETLYYLTNLDYMITFPDYPSVSNVEYLHQLEIISKRWLNRLINKTLIDSILKKADATEDLGNLLNSIHDKLSKFNLDFDEINDMTSAWTTITLTVSDWIKKLEEEKDSLVASILSSVQEKIDKIANDLANIKELFFKVHLLTTPAYQFDIDRKYIALISNVSLINNVTVSELSIENTELLKYNNEDIELEKLQETLGGSYEVSKSMIHRYTDEYASDLYPIINSFRTLQEISAAIFYLENDELKLANLDYIPSGIYVSKLELENSKFSDLELALLYAKSGLIESARLLATDVTAIDLASFDEELVEKPIDETNKYITNSELLLDPYFKNMYSEDEPFTIVNDALLFKLSSIAIAASNNREGLNSNFSVSFANANSLCIKDIVTNDYKTTTNQYTLARYNELNSKINNEYYQARQSSNGLAERLGLMTIAIEEPTTPYIIKTHNYSEQVYGGSIELLSNIKVPGQTIPLPKGLSISNQIYEIVVSYILNKNIIRIAEPSLIIPSSISIYESNSDDVESIINKGKLTNEIYNFDSELKVVEFSSDIKLTIPATSKLFIFISSIEQPYIFGNGRYVLYFDRV